VRSRRPYAVVIWKDGRRYFYGFAHRSQAEAFRAKEAGQHPRISPVITLGGARGGH
jgi:hypothetical protein